MREFTPLPEEVERRDLLHGAEVKNLLGSAGRAAPKGLEPPSANKYHLAWRQRGISGRMMREGAAGLWCTVCEAGRGSVSVAMSRPVFGLRS